MTECDDYISEDQLVLYIEEKTNDEIDMRCFIIFDKYEQEYYITGLRNHINAVQFKFYSKSKTSLFSFIELILEPNCKINYMLYNMSNLDYVDFFVFKQNYRNSREIVGYNDMFLSETKNSIKKILKNLKYVRY
jgi:hypothetical protein